MERHTGKQQNNPKTDENSPSDKNREGRRVQRYREKDRHEDREPDRQAHAETPTGKVPDRECQTNRTRDMHIQDKGQQSQTTRNLRGDKCPPLSGPALVAPRFELIDTGLDTLDTAPTTLLRFRMVPIVIVRKLCKHVPTLPAAIGLLDVMYKQHFHKWTTVIKQ